MFSQLMLNITVGHVRNFVPRGSFPSGFVSSHTNVCLDSTEMSPLLSLYDPVWRQGIPTGRCIVRR